MSAIEKQREQIREKIVHLQEASLKQEQIDIPIVHRFAQGVYAREMTMPKGSMVVGKIHLQEHLCFITKGKVLVVSEFGKDVLQAPCTFVSKPGTKRALYALEETIFTTVHGTEETEVKRLEDTLVVDNYEDFKSAIESKGMNEQLLSEITQDESDQVEMPEGVMPYSIKESEIHGVGYFLDSPAQKGDMLAPASINLKRTPAGRYVNHSAEPNAIMKVIGSDIYLVATKDIESEEVTVDYRESYDAISSLMEGLL